MAIDYKQRYPDQVATDANYPQGKARNKSTPAAIDGTPFEEDYINDQWGFFQALLKEGGLTPSGNADNANNSQYLEAIRGIVKEPLTLKIFQSPTDNLTKVTTFAGGAGVAYEVRKTSDNSLATIYSDKDGANEILQNGTSNVSDSSGVVAFYIADGDYYVEVDSIQISFEVDVLRQELAATDSNTQVGGEAAGDIANNMIAPVLRGKSITPPIMTGLIPSRKSALLKISDEQYRSYLHLGGRTWQVSDFANSGLDAAGNTTPFGWNQTMIQDFAESIIWGDAEVTTGSGTWTDLSSSDPNPYLGHRAAQTTTVGAFVEVSLQVGSGEADITLNFTGRNNGNIIDVTIDGSTALVNEATTVDTYTPIDLTHRQTKLVASGLPARVSPYLVRFTLSAAKNQSSLAGDRFIFSGLTIEGDSFGNPWSPSVRPKVWMPTTAYAQYEEVIGGGGRIYVCTVAGTSGTEIPSHTSGSATDGNVTWLLIKRSAFVTDSNRSDTLQAAGSQLEYAYEFRPTLSDPYQDVGGNLHGNEYLTSALTISADGLTKSLENGSYAVGYQLILNQKIRAYYGIVTATSTDICDTSLTHSIGNGKIVVSHESKMLSDGNFGYHYPAMWPVVHFNGVTAKLVCPQMELAQTGRVDLIDYAGIVNPFVGASTDLQMRAIGDIYRPIGAGGVPSTDDGEYHCIMSLTASNYGVGDYEYGSRLASIAPNLSGAVTPSGFSSWVGKMYFARSNTDKPEPVTIGQVIRADNEYKVSLFRK
ncbi:hypothetical protein [Pseudoalteromonas phage J2-1]|uniref:Tail fiber protein n=1 Tax=Pseudoalteromonas phage J2-1 TaxID=2023998 RepID=A0A223LIQ1_9CAUD|nr:hypothetical protein HOR90_gp72 [Pseudoalteromonas phage J2-1]ASU03359.1 hypothetical protein [Pseudoalteromonas phage J2-1]